MEKKLPKLKKKEQTYDIDPSQTYIYCIFTDGSLARIVKTMDDLDSQWGFYLVPTKDLKSRYAERLKEDTSYDATEDLYVKKIDKSKCILLDPHPLFQRWLILTDWWLGDRNPIDIKLDELAIENDRLQKQRDIYSRKIKSLVRQMDKLVKYPQASRKELIKEIASELKEVNAASPLANLGKGE